MTRRLAVPAVVSLVAVALMALLAFGVMSQSPDRTIEDALAAGERPAAPSRSLPILGEPGQRSVRSYRGRIVVLNFWASWCDPCRAEAPVLQRTHRQLARNGGTVLGVSFRDTPSDAQKFNESFGISYPSVRDREGQLAKDYGTVALPETFVIDPRGRIVAAKRGTVDQAWMDQTLRRFAASR